MFLVFFFKFVRDKTDQRYKMGNKKLDQLGYGVKKVKEAMR